MWLLEVARDTESIRFSLEQCLSMLLNAANDLSWIETRWLYRHGREGDAGWGQVGWNYDSRGLANNRF